MGRRRDSRDHVAPRLGPDRHGRRHRRSLSRGERKGPDPPDRRAYAGDQRIISRLSRVGFAMVIIWGGPPPGTGRHRAITSSISWSDLVKTSMFLSIRRTLEMKTHRLRAVSAAAFVATVLGAGPVQSQT